MINNLKKIREKETIFVFFNFSEKEIEDICADYNIKNTQNYTKYFDTFLPIENFYYFLKKKLNLILYKFIDSNLNKRKKFNKENISNILNNFNLLKLFIFILKNRITPLFCIFNYLFYFEKDIYFLKNFNKLKEKNKLKILKIPKNLKNIIKFINNFFLKDKKIWKDYIFDFILNNRLIAINGDLFKEEILNLYFTEKFNFIFVKKEKNENIKFLKSII